jgi:hypothetical protein
MDLIAIAMAVAAVAQTIGEPPQPIDCTELRALVESARAATPFADFPAAYEARGPVPGYGAQCHRGQRQAAGTLYCQFMRRGGALRQTIADEIAACLPDAAREPEASPPPDATNLRRNRAGRSTFRADGVTIHLANSDPRTIVGYEIYLIIGRNPPGLD